MTYRPGLATLVNHMPRDVDQIKADLLSSRHLAQFKDSKVTEDLPGLGRNYCVECAKWFDTEKTLIAHQRSKPHKRRSGPFLAWLSRQCILFVITPRC